MASLLIAVGALLWIAKLGRDLFWPQQQSTRISDQPVYIDIVKEFTPLGRTEQLESEMRAGFGKLGAQITTVDNERRASVGRAYDLSRKLIQDLQDRINTMHEDQRREIKDDMAGVHNRITDVLKAVARIEGQCTKCNE